MRSLLPSALPQLRGRALAVFRVVWIGVAALAIVGALVGAWQSETYYERETKPFNDLGLRTRGMGRTLGSPLGSAARASGIARGSVILAIEGRALPVGADKREVRDRLLSAPGPSVSLRTRAPDGNVREHVLTRSPVHVAEAFAGTGMTFAQRRAIEVALGLASTLLLLIAAMLLFVRRAADPMAALLSLAFVCVCVASNPSAAFFADGLGWPLLPTAFTAIGFSALFLAVSVFPQGRFEPRWTAWLAVLIGVWGLLSIPVSLGGPRSYNVLNVTGFALFSASLAAMAIRYRQLPEGMQRQQIRWVFLGFATAAILALVWVPLGIVLPSIEQDRMRAWVSLAISVTRDAGLSAIALGLLFSLLRYRLYDADMVISRSASYGALTLLLAGTFAASAKAIEWFMEVNFGRDAGALPGAIGAGLAVVLITPMHRRIQDWAEGRFHKGLLRLRRDLPESVRELRETAGMQELLDDVLARIESAVHAVRSAVVIDGRVVATRGIDPEAVNSDSFALAVPLSMAFQDEEIGTLLVGPRPDGSAVGKDEREALTEIADPIARAIRIVRLREQRESKSAEALGKVAERISALEALMGDTALPNHPG